jgi:hypothetical protein
MNLRKRASLGLVVILIAATLGIFAYVMANGSTPVGPTPTSSIVVNELDVLAVGTVSATNIDSLDFTDGNFSVSESPDGEANISLANSVTLVDEISADEFIFNGDTTSCPTTSDRLLQTAAGEISFCARGDVRFRFDTNANGTNCFQAIAETANTILRACEGSTADFIENDGVVRTLVQTSASCVDDTVGASIPLIQLTPTQSYARINVGDPDGCDLEITETGASEGSLLTVINCCQTNSLIINEIANQVMTQGAAVTLGRYDSASFIYINDRWVMTATSNN